MENASKALLMAAGVLIGVMILSTIVVFKSVFGNFSAEYYQKLNIQKMQEFNTNFTKYENRKDLTAQDIVTIANFAKEWNNTVGDNDYIKINSKKPDEASVNRFKILSNEFLENCSIYTDASGKIQNYKYSIKINGYSAEGRINNVTVTLL